MKTIKQGMRDEAVKVMQTELSRLGYNLTADGAFGPGTLAAVKDFQHKHGLSVDGIAGYSTWEAVLFADRPAQEKLTEEDFVLAARLLDCEAAALKAVQKVETGGRGGFFAPGKPAILFEGMCSGNNSGNAVFALRNWLLPIPISCTPSGPRAIIREGWANMPALRRPVRYILQLPMHLPVGVCFRSWDFILPRVDSALWAILWLPCARVSAVSCLPRAASSARRTGCLRHFGPRSGPPLPASTTEAAMQKPIRPQAADSLPQLLGEVNLRWWADHSDGLIPSGRG